MRAVALAFLAMVGVSCSAPGAGAAPSATPLPSDPLDPAVAIPSTFPADFPLYTGARPVKVTYHTDGSIVWEIAWETLDGLNQVQPFYSQQLSEGNWSTSSEMSSDTQYTATFTHVTGVTWSGLLTVDTTSKQGVTKISVVLTRTA